MSHLKASNLFIKPAGALHVQQLHIVFVTTIPLYIFIFASHAIFIFYHILFLQSCAINVTPLCEAIPFFDLIHSLILKAVSLLHSLSERQYTECIPFCRFINFHDLYSHLHSASFLTWLPFI